MLSGCCGLVTSKHLPEDYLFKWNRTRDFRHLTFDLQLLWKIIPVDLQISGSSQYPITEQTFNLSQNTIFKKLIKDGS